MPQSFPGHDDRSGLPPGRWVGGDFVAHGAHGTVHCWILLGRNDKILDRIAIKDLWITDSTQEPPEYVGVYQKLVRRGLDLGVTANSGKPGTARPSERFCKEAYLQGMMTGREHQPGYTMPLRGYKKGPPNPERPAVTHWRLYMGYCKGGDISDYLGGMLKPISEPFMWWTLTCLARALVYMEYRPRIRIGAREQYDEAIVMVDIKTENVLMSIDQGRHEYPMFPQPLISDFGSAYLMYKEDPLNRSGGPFKFVQLGYNAPEIEINLGAGGAVEDPLHSWTNVWQVGRTIEYMMRLQYVPYQPDYTDTSAVEDSLKTNPPAPKGSDSSFKYSDDLIEIICRCLRFQPHERPTPVDILQYIEQHASKHVQGMDKWGTEEWIETHENSQRMGLEKKGEWKPTAEELEIIRNFLPSDLVDRYVALGLELPEGCTYFKNLRPVKPSARAGK